MINKRLALLTLLMLSISACGGSDTPDNNNPIDNIDNTPTPTPPPVTNIAGTVAIEGTAQQGQNLTAIISDQNNGVQTDSPSYAWFADGEQFLNQTQPQFTVPRSAVGKTISVTVNYTDGDGFNENITSDSTTTVSRIANSEGVLLFTNDLGDAPSLVENAIIKVNIEDANGVSGGINYFWYADSELVSEQNQVTYTLLDADVGKTISVRVEYQDDDGYNESQVLATTEQVVSNSLVPNGQDFPVGASIAGNNPIDRNAPVSQESFELAGWNAGTINGDYNPGRDASIPKQFRFTQFQNPDSFQAETIITRFGSYSAKLYWQSGDPGKWNDDPNKIDNVDRKAMLHGRNANSITSTVWHGFSVYFPSEDINLKDGENPLFFQLHGAADPGEPGRQPPVALTIQTDGFYVGYGWDARAFNTSTSGQGRDKFHIPLNMADYQDRWLDFVIQVKANPFEETGFIKLWINGIQMADRINIQIGYNDAKGLYPSWGWYFTGTTNVTRESDGTLYLDEIRHVEADDANYFDVAPGYFSK